MKSLRTNPPAIRTHGLRPLGKIKPPKPKHEHEWNYISDWPDCLLKQHCVLYRCSTCEEEMVIRLDDQRNEISREITPKA